MQIHVKITKILGIYYQDLYVDINFEKIDIINKYFQQIQR